MYKGYLGPVKGGIIIEKYNETFFQIQAQKKIPNTSSWF